MQPPQSQACASNRDPQAKSQTAEAGMTLDHASSSSDPEIISKKSTSSDAYLELNPMIRTQDGCHQCIVVPPNRHDMAEVPIRSASNQSAVFTVATAGQKRRLPSTRLKSSIHKPFRSPVRTARHMDVNLTVEKNTDQTSLTQTTTTMISAPTPTSTLMHESPPRSSVRFPSSNTPTIGKRLPFRSPISGSQKVLPSGTTAYGRMLQIQTLQAKVTELQSSIRKGKQILKQQQKNEVPIEDLIAKWKKASQEGARVLLEHYVKQQSFLGDGWDDNNDSVSNSKLSTTARYRDYDSLLNMFTTGPSSLQELGPTGLYAMEKYIEHQDVEQDLPTVNEALRSRCWPEATTLTSQPVKITKMQRLLLGLGVDLDIIGYDPEQDAFIS